MYSRTMSFSTSAAGNSQSQKPTSRTNAPLTMTDTVGADGELDPAALIQLAESEMKKEIVGDIRKWYQKCKDQLDPLKRQWYLNLSFYKGDQYVDFIQGRIVQIPGPRNKVRLTINRILPVVRTEMSRMTSQEVNAEVIPATTDDDDILRAESAQSVWTSARRAGNLKDAQAEAAYWVSTCGTGFIKTWWDKSHEEENAKGMVELGKIVYTSVSPFHLLVPDLLEQDIQKQPYVLNVFTKPVDWIRSRYGEILPEDYKPTVVGSQEIIESRYLNTKEQANDQAKPDSSLIIEAWIKPGTVKWAPKGALITIVDQIVIQASIEGIPYEHGEYPFHKEISIPTGSFYGMSSVEPLIPAQIEYNANRSQQATARRLMANPGLFYTEGSIDPNKYTNATGQMVGVKPGAPMPTPTPVPQMPSFVVNEIELIHRDIEDISGQHQVSKGNTPAGVSAGTALQFLAEQDNSYMSTTFDSIERAVEGIAKHTIALFVQYCDSPRLIKYVGREGSLAVNYLSGADVKGATDIRVEGGSSLPESKAARVALFTDWISRGILPPQDGLELMNLPSMKSYWDIAKVDENQAKRENLRIRELDETELTQLMAEMDAQKEQITQRLAMWGIDPTNNPIAAQELELFNEPVIPVNDFDNHEVHIEIHTRFMKGQEYESMPQVYKDQYERHVQMHEDKMAQKTLEKMIQMGMGNASEPSMEQPGAEGAAPEGEEGNNPEGENQFDGSEQAAEQSVDEPQP